MNQSPTHPISPATHPSSLLLAALRLVLYFALLCALALQAGFEQRRASFTPRNVPLDPPVSLLDHQPGPMPGITLDLEPYTPLERAALLGELAGYGFRWVRVHIDWAQIEPQPGVFVWEETDATLGALAQSGLLPVMVLSGSPDWARSPPDQGGPPALRAPPQDPTAFAKFAAEFARRYAGIFAQAGTSGAGLSDVEGEEPSATEPAPTAAAVRYYQIWREPNIAPNWGNRHIDPVGYARLTRVTADAIRAADAQAVILAAGLAPTTDRGHLAQDEVYFLQRFLAAGGGHAIDVFAIQPFGFAQPPLPARVIPDRLGFDRVRYVRRALEDAGYGHKPVWAVEFGWNRQANAIWRAVTPATQLAYTREARALAHDWPWLQGLGWPIYAGEEASDHPRAGFALTPELARAITGDDQRELDQREDDNGQTLNLPWHVGHSINLHPSSFIPQWLVWFGLLALLSVSVQRSWAAAMLLRPHVRVSAPSWAALIAWGVLALIYYVATWPPLIALCWLAAGWGVWRQPRHGLYAAALLLPFYFQHKEMRIVDMQISAPPAYVFVAALIPPLARRAWQQGRHANGSFFTGWGWVMGASWLVIGMAAGVVSGVASVEPDTIRRLPAFAQGLLEMTVIPLILYWAVLAYASAPRVQRTLLIFLAAGGAAAGLLGLGQWLGGEGVRADATLRLTGPYFSPNHMALYLIRTLFVALGLAWAMRAGWRWLWLALGLMTGVMLVLTGSRGALLLGAPAGLYCFWRWGMQGRIQWPERLPRRIDISAYLPWPVGHSMKGRLAAIGVLTVLVLVVVFAIGVERLVNLASVVERWHVWQASTRLWMAHWATGVGPGGYYWTFPAYIPLAVEIDHNLRHPHNVWLEVLTTWGVAGAVWFGVMGYWLARCLRAGVPFNPLHSGVLAGLAAGLAHAQVDAFMALPDLAAWNALALGVLLSINKR
jgi:hypothetical protein